MASNLNALDAFRSAVNWQADAIANINDGNVEQNGVYTGRFSAIRRQPVDCQRNNAMRTALLNALGNAFATTGAEDVEEGHFSADFMSKLERLIGKDFKSSDFGIDRESGLVKSGRPLTARRITAILSRIDRVDEAGRNMRKCGIDKLGDQSSAAEIHRALENFAKEVDRVGGKNKDLVRTRLVQSAIVSLPEDSKRALAAALRSAAGQNLLGFYNAAAASQNRNKDFYFGVVMQIVEQLRTSLGLPNDGLPHLMRNARAKVALQVQSGDFEVFALDGDGSRRRTVPSEFKNGRLAFVADIAADHSAATYMYEVVRRR